MQLRELDLSKNKICDAGIQVRPLARLHLQLSLLSHCVQCWRGCASLHAVELKLVRGAQAIADAVAGTKARCSNLYFVSTLRVLDPSLLSSLLTGPHCWLVLIVGWSSLLAGPHCWLVLIVGWSSSWLVQALLSLNLAHNTCGVPGGGALERSVPALCAPRHATLAGQLGAHATALCAALLPG